VLKHFLLKNINNYFNRVRAGLVVVSLLVLAVYPFIPERRLDLLNSPYTHLFVYNDSSENGNSSAIQNPRDGKSFTCHIQTGANYPYCGIAIKHLDREGRAKVIDLSKFHSLELDLHYSGTAQRMVLFYRDTADNSQKLVTSNERYIFTYINRHELNRPVAAYLDNFILAEWWLNMFFKERSQMRLAREKIVEFGLGTPSDIELGEHHFRLNSLVAIGQWVSRESLYLYIIVFWMAVALFEVLMRLRLLVGERQKMSASLGALMNKYADLKHAATTDQLTQLYNRNGFIRNLSKIILMGEQYYLYVIDIDKFKNINDSYGHDKGDIVLAHIAAVLKANCRTDDILARWGGEEFVLFAGQQSDQAAYQLADKLRRIVEASTCTINEELRIGVTISVGISRYDYSGGFELAFKRADEALYSAKHGGRNQVVSH